MFSSYSLTLPQFISAKGRKCSKPIRNSTVYTLQPQNVQYSVNANVTVGCQRGFTGNQVTIRCMANGSWSKNNPVCSRKIVTSKYKEIR